MGWDLEIEGKPFPSSVALTQGLGHSNRREPEPARTRKFCDQQAASFAASLQSASWIGLPVSKHSVSWGVSKHSVSGGQPKMGNFLRNSNLLTIEGEVEENAQKTTEGQNQ